MLRFCPSVCERYELAVGGRGIGSSLEPTLWDSLGRRASVAVDDCGSAWPLLGFLGPLVGPPCAVDGLSSLNPPREGVRSPDANLCPLLVPGLLCGWPG
jgi:hypothetical protein